MQEVSEPVHKCCFCGKSFRGKGIRPFFLNSGPNAVCCSICNNTLVIPARVANIYDRAV